MYADARLLLRHDVSAGALPFAAIEAQKFITKRAQENRFLIYHDFEYWAKHAPDNLFLEYAEDGRRWTYKEFFECICKVGSWLVEDLGIQKNEIVALDGGNSPEYLMLWFGLESVGACNAFINCHLTKEPLVHSVKLCGARYALVDKDVAGLVEPCQQQLTENGCDILWYDRNRLEEITRKESKYASRTPDELRSGLQPLEASSLIYTSGTTGLPKGTIMIRARELVLSQRISKYLGLQPHKHKMFTCLPLYHGAAHGLCVTPSIHAGSSVVLSRKFSHKTFWPEVRKSKANILQYVGELCRYLVNAPPNPQDKDHSIQMAWGNGMRPDVWEVFRQRFGIPEIHELYAATDGLAASFNLNKGPFGVNAIGKRGLLWTLFNGRIEKRVKMDIDTEEIVRDPRTGFAVEAQLGEPGQTVIKIVDESLLPLAFMGYYKNDTASKKRLTRNLFKKGDLWFLSGDMLRQEADGTVYFVDRLGDTYRWKSENVSTNEVSDAMGQYEQIAETNVVGVQVPRSDGRCGLAAVVLKDGLTEEQVSWEGLARHSIGTLPRYAVPIFVRVVKSLDYTGTFKIQKGRLKGEGIDLDKIQANKNQGGGTDSMYWLPPGKSVYVPFKTKDWEDLQSGRVRL